MSAPKQPPGQGQLAPPPRKAHYHDDYIGVLPSKVRPINLECLEQGDHLLFVKRYGHKDIVTPKQRHIFRLLVKLGEAETSGGSVTVLCLWGVHGTTRAIARFDYTGIKEATPADDQQVQRAILDWWRNCDRHR